MGEFGINDRKGSILRKGDDRSFIRAVGRREGARAAKDGQAETVLKTDDRLAYVTTRSGFQTLENEILVSHTL
jgi:hypothetical protein